jgi:hypothetical protein
VSYDAQQLVGGFAEFRFSRHEHSSVAVCMLHEDLFVHNVTRNP